MTTIRSPRRSWTNAENRVDAQLVQAVRLTKTGAALEINVIRGKRKLGRLSVGEGGIIWRPAHAQTRIRLSWPRFAQLMEEHGRRSPIEAPPAF